MNKLYNSILREGVTNSKVLKIKIFITSIILILFLGVILFATNSITSHVFATVTKETFYKEKQELQRSQKPKTIDEAVVLGIVDKSTVDALRSTGHADVLLTVKYNDVLPGRNGRRGTHADAVKLSKAVLPRKIDALKSGAEGVTKLQDYDMLPIIFLRVTSEVSLLRLISAKDTVSIRFNYENKLHLAQSLPLIRLPDINPTDTTGKGISVAMIDSGVDYTKPIFGDCTDGTPTASPAAGGPDCAIAYAHNFGGGDLDNRSDFHGTVDAAIIHNIVPGAKIYSLGAFGNNGVYDNAVTEAINWVVDKQDDYKIRVLNMSFGQDHYDESNCSQSDSDYSASFLILRGLGVLPVASAGNRAYPSGQYRDGVASPSCAAGAVSVGAVYDSDVGQRPWKLPNDGKPDDGTINDCLDSITNENTVACFSQSGSRLSMLAPGSIIDVPNLPQGLSGTSQAAPHVSGAAALLAAAYPNASTAKIESALVNSGKLITFTRQNNTDTFTYSRHRLDLVDALNNMTKPDAMIDEANCLANVLPRNDDESTASVALPFTANFFGTQYGSVYVNNNGNLTFNAPMRIYTPYTIDANVPPIIAPYFADVDTRADGSDEVTYGNITYGGNPAFCVNWNRVGYYDTKDNLLNDFQLLLVSRTDLVAGDFDIIMNYNKLTWETGQASGGIAGFNGTPAGAGYSAGDGNADHFYQFPGSLQHNGLIDTNLSGLALVKGSRGSLQNGRYIFPIRNGLPPGTAGVTGNVFGPDSAPLVNAPVEACKSAEYCVTTHTDNSGHYSLTALSSGTYDVIAYSPSNTTFLRSTEHGVTLSNGSVSTVNFQLKNPTPPPAGTTITHVRTANDGIPVLYWNTPNTLSTSACQNGTGTFEYKLADGSVIRSGQMTESPAGSGNYTSTTDTLTKSIGSAEVTIHITCPNTDENKQIVFNIYIDPSGIVQDTAGHPITDATVTLYRSDTENGPFEAVANGSEIMSPSNRANPVTTGNDGIFGWDVIAGFYRVRASKNGCVSPSDPSQAYVESPTLTIPPAETGATLTLSCESTVTNTPTPTPTNTPTPTPTNTPTPTDTPTPTPTNTPSPTPTNTPTPTPTNTPTPSPIPTYNITGNVFVDSNHNGFRDSGEAPYQYVNVALESNSNGNIIQSNTTTDQSGNYSFNSLSQNTYTITLSLPTGYGSTTTNPVTIPLSANTTVNFGIAPMPTNTPSPTNTPTPTRTPTPTPTRTPTPTPGDITAPSVSITFPANNTIILHGATLTISASATDNVGVRKVEFYVNNVLKCTDTTTPYTCGWTVPSGTSTITAKAYDAAGNTRISSAATVIGL